ncbi:MAG: hypothetical protein ABL921_06060 [Pirellula sp.]
MQEYTIQRSTRKCQRENRSFEPDERYYSVVLQKGGELIRQDFCKQAWQGPPENTVGWWMSRMPAKRTGKLTLAPVNVLLDALEKLAEEPNEADLAYLLAILLVRRRILTNESDDLPSDEATHLRLTHGMGVREFLVPIQPPNGERAELLHQQLVDLLYCEA